MDSKTLYSKLSSVPTPISTWLGSEAVIDFVEKIPQQFNLPDYSAAVISKIIQRMQILELAPEYFAGQISLELNLEKNKTLLIADAINKNIFGPIKNDLDSYGLNTKRLEEFNLPLKDSANIGPKIINDVATPLPKAAPLPPPIPTGTATSQTINGVPTFKTTQLANSNIVPNAPKTNRLSDVGWSRSRTADPVVKLDVSQVPPSNSVPPTTPTSTPRPVQQPGSSVAPQAQAVNFNKPAPLGEFERMNSMKKAGSPTAPSVTAAAVPTTAPSEPAPFILHQDDSASIAPKSAGFKISEPQATADMHLSSVKSQSTVKPAVLEFGQSTKPPAPATSSSTTTKVVHYTEFQPALSKVPTQDSGPRQVSQIVAAVPTPTQMPTPPAASASGIPVPKPTIPANTPAKPPQEKVIVQDFL